MGRVLGFLLFLLALASTAGLLSSFYWLFDLFNHLRVHALVASVVLCVAAFVMDRKQLLPAGLLLALNAVLFMLPLDQSSGISNLSIEGPFGQSVKIVSANVYTANQNYEEAIAVLTKDNPDIIAFTETDERWIRQLAVLEKIYPYSIKHPRPDNFGMALYSKLFFKAEIRDIGDYKLPMAIAEFAHFKLFVAHPIPPMSSRSMGENHFYLETLAQLIETEKGPVVVASDLNRTLWGDAMKPLFKAGLKRVNPLGIAYTWPTQNPLLAMQIDHFLAKNVTETAFKVLPEIGSDHYPIQAVIQLPLKH